MSIEVVGVNQSWTQPSTLLPISSSTSPATSSTITTPPTSASSPTILATSSPISPPSLPLPTPSLSPTSIQAINTVTADESGTTSPGLCATIIKTDADHPSDPPTIEASDDNSIETNVADGQTGELSPDSDVALQQEQQQLSVILPPLPDLIPIRKAQIGGGIDTSNTISCCSNSNQQSPAATSSSSQILSVSSKNPVEEDDNDNGDNDDIDDDPQHSTFEEATSTSVATSTGLDNQTIMYHDGNMLQQQHSAMLPEQILTPTAAANTTNGVKKRGRKIKTEVEDPELCPIPHRKSDRRRVARDIFLVFEEHPANRRRGKAGRAKQPKGRPKSKFAHLMTDTKKQKKTTVGTMPPVRIKTEPKTPTTSRKSLTPAPAPAPPPPAAATVPRVNPIFLWVKQDDTRIVEVRCEDYDKRNRIRLTKTANGWRAIPRTDPSSSRVAKLLPNPVVKIKQERIEETMRNSVVPVSPPQPPPSSPSPPPMIPPPVSPPAVPVESEVMAPTEPLKPLKILQPTEAATSHAAKKKKKKKKKKKRKHDDEEERDDSKKQQQPEEEVIVPPAITENPIISTEPNHLVYESTNHEREEEDEDEEEAGEEVDIKEVIQDPLKIPMAHNQDPEDEDDEDDDDDDEEQEEEEAGGDLVQHMEPNNNEPSEELSKNLTQISDDLDLDDIPQFMQDVNPGTLQLCPETGLFIQKPPLVEDDHEHEQEQDHQVHDHHENHVNPVVLSDSFDGSDVDTKNLKDLLDDADLLQHCSDNAMSGAELIDSLVKRGCEDNHISGDEPSIKETICLDDFENEDDDVLMQPEPVADIISRLGGSLTASPKCLSFNEAGEIEGLHGELFQSTTQNDPFNRQALEELSITIKDLEKSVEETYNSPAKTKPVESVTIVSPDSCVDEMPKDLTCKKSVVEKEKPQPTTTTLLERPNSRSSDAIQSPQPSGLPAVPPSPDLVHSKSKNVFLEQLLNSSSSISPKICSSVTVTPIKIPNAPVKQQKEPLDLGKHRKSASPTVSCSEEAKRVQTVTIDDDSPDEPLQKRIKREVNEEDTAEKSHTENLIEMLSSGKDPDPLTQLRLLIRNPEWKVPDPILVPKDRLSAVLASPAREIPLLLTTRPELRLPEAFAYPAILQDPDILVISMAQLETILQKQVEMTRPKAKTPPIPQVTIEAIPNPAKSRVSDKPVCAPSPDITVSSKKSAPSSSSSSQSQQNKNFMNPLMGDIDAATLAAFNQMLWLPYLGQMAPDFLKAIAGLQNANSLAELLPLLQQQQNAIQQQHSNQQQQNQKSTYPTPQFNPMAAAAAAAGLTNPMAAAAAFQNPLELAMWQEALTQAQMQRMMKMNAAAALAAQQQQQRESTKKSAANIDTKANATRNHYNNVPKQTPSNPPPPYHHPQLSQSNQRHLSASDKPNSSSARSVPNPFYRPPAAGSTESSSAHRAKQKSQHQQQMQQQQQHQQQQQQQQHHQDQKPRVTCKSLSNLLQPERLSDAKMSNLMAMPGFDFGFNGSASAAAAAASANPFQFASAAAAAAAAAASTGRSSGVGQFANGGGGVGGGGGSGNHAAALHRNNHTASNMHGNMTANQQHQQQQHHQQHLQQQQQQQQQQHQQQQQQQQAKLKVKPGSHLIDPAALQRRLLNCEDMSEVGSTTNGLEEMMTDPNAALWHPLFGNTQKAGYNSPWQWTTVTASGE